LSKEPGQGILLLVIGLHSAVFPAHKTYIHTHTYTKSVLFNVRSYLSMEGALL
jgi:hypothetical protein